MKKITQAELEVIKEKHVLWLNDERGGLRADLSDCDCSGLDFSYAIMTDVNMAGANMTDVDMNHAIMTDSIMTDVDMTRANMTRANMNHAIMADSIMTDVDMTRANMTDVNMNRAIMTDANMTDVNMTRAIMIDVNMTDVDMTDVDMTDAIMTRAIMIDANMTDVNMTGTRLWNTIGNGKEIKSAQLGCYYITYTADVLQIGCEQHPINDWFQFDEERIYEMDGQRAVDYWKGYKDTIHKIVTKNPAIKSGG